MRTFGTRACGLRAPIVRESDNLVEIVCQSVENYCREEGVKLREKDVLGITEAVVARSQGNYATVDQIAECIRRLFKGKDYKTNPTNKHVNVGVVFPILSRNRFSVILKSISKALDKVTVMLSYPKDEVGNQLISSELFLEKSYNAPYQECLTEKEFRDRYGWDTKHPFTDMDYIEYYKSLGDNIEIVFSNDPRNILKYTKQVIVADIHTRFETKKKIKSFDKDAYVIGVDEIMTESVDGSGFNKEYGLLGSNIASEKGKLKLFPRDCNVFVKEVQAAIEKKLGKKIEVLVYGDGGFKDPVGGIWELADPVVSPGYTDGLKGLPAEIKLKYLIDNDLHDIPKDKIEEKAKQIIKDGSPSQLGTTPRKISDLIGSLCDLMSGSGDKGTPIILIQGYFDKYSTE